MNRRLAAVAVLVLSLAAASPGPVNRKRGVSCGGPSAAVMNAGWYYSWYIDPAPGVRAEFVPMIAHGRDANSWYWDRMSKLKQGGRVTTLLGFNEPERKPPGGDISVNAAIAAWPAFMATGLLLGSPAPAYDPAGRAWLTDFMAKAAAKHLRVDFVAVHWYGDVAGGAANAADFMAWLNGIHRQYGKPVWVTEFAGLNWDWLHHPITADQDARFLAALEPQLERTPWVERYCWFNDGPAKLFDDRAQAVPSRVGVVYRGGR